MPGWSSTEATFAATFDVVEDVRFSADISSTDATFDFSFSGETSLPENYLGPYDITPLFSTQVLPTAKRLMRQDVTVKKIPQYEVSNDYGGYTLIIGDEYYNAQ